MEDDEEDCPLWWQTQTPLQEFNARRKAAVERAETETRARYEHNAVWHKRNEEFKNNPEQRKWAMWREYKAGGTTLDKVAKNFGVTRERVRQSNAKCDRKLRTVLNPNMMNWWKNVPDEIRDATLGVEFVFKNDLAFSGWDGDSKGWAQLEPDNYNGSAYTLYKIGAKP
jgi:hypothetical protein